MVQTLSGWPSVTDSLVIRSDELLMKVIVIVFFSSFFSESAVPLTSDGSGDRIEVIRCERRRQHGGSTKERATARFV